MSRGQTFYMKDVRDENVNEGFLDRKQLMSLLQKKENVFLTYLKHAWGVVTARLAQ